MSFMRRQEIKNNEERKSKNYKFKIPQFMRTSNGANSQHLLSCPPSPSSPLPSPTSPPPTTPTLPAPNSSNHPFPEDADEALLLLLSTLAQKADTQLTEMSHEVSVLRTKLEELS